MIRVRRNSLSDRCQRYLNRKSNEVLAKRALAQFDIQREWKSARQTQTVGLVFEQLQRMISPLGKCMYCVASIGSDIEHFWPKTKYPLKAFDWENLLLCCTDCGRHKGEFFPLDDAGAALLVNPAVANENPWDFIEFDHRTGNLTAKYDLVSQDYHIKGVKTVELLKLDQREAISDSYRRSYKRICNVINDFLETQTTNKILFDNLVLADENGILEWCICHAGKNLNPFATLKDNYHETWEYLSESIM